MIVKQCIVTTKDDFVPDHYLVKFLCRRIDKKIELKNRRKSATGGEEQSIMITEDILSTV